MENSKEEKIPLKEKHLPNTFTSDTFKGMYAIHKYWSKKPRNVINQFIKSFTYSDEIVLDPFAGYGVTLTESIALDRKAIGVDINPASIRIIKGLLYYCDIVELDTFFNQWMQALAKTSSTWFSTSCNKRHRAHRTHTLIEDGKPKLIRYYCDKCNEKGEKSPNADDLLIWNESQKLTLDEKNFPLFLVNKRISIPENTRISSFFTKRNFLVINEAFQKLGVFDKTTYNHLVNVFTAAIPQASKMVFVITKRKNVKQKPEVGSWVAGFWKPSTYWEISPIHCFNIRFKKYIRGKRGSNIKLPKIIKLADSFNEITRNTPLLVQGSSTNLQFIPNSSIDYILTDPPHGDRIPYLEYSQLWNSFFKDKIDWENEIIVSDRTEYESKREKYKSLLSKSISETSKKLKRGKFYSIFFQNLDFDYWETLLSSFIMNQMNLIRIDTISTSAGSVVQDTRKNSLAEDILLTFRKEKNKHLRNNITLNAANSDKIALEVILAEENKEFKTYEALEWILQSFIKEKAMDRNFNLIKFLEQNFEYKKGNWTNKR